MIYYTALRGAFQRKKMYNRLMKAHKTHWLFCAALVAALALIAQFSSCASDASSKGTEVVLDPAYYTDLFTYDNADTLLGRGINLGNYFEAPKTASHPLSEGEWTGGRKAQASDFTIMAQAGFKTVRIPVRWSDHADKTAPYTINPAFLARVQEVIQQARTAGLVVVLNVHHYEQMMNNPSSALAGHKERLSAIWDQLSQEFPISAYGRDELIFELLNEPNGTVGYDDWNDIIENLTTIIWSQHSATQTGRRIMVGTANWGGVPGLKRLQLPSACTKDNTIITVHYYEPFQFTHQGAEWTSGAKAWIGTTWTGKDEEKAPLLSLLDSIVEWNAQSNRGFEIFMGEFGVYTKHARADHQKAWTAFIAREAERRKMSWAYWEYSSGFGAWNPETGTWREQLFDALIPREDRPN